MLRDALVALTVLVAAVPFASGAQILEDDSGRAIGRIALPTDPASATVLVVAAHGYGHTTASWAGHLDVFAADGAIAVAPEYGNWEVSKGAAALVSVTKATLAQYPDLDTVILFAVSMGGSMSGVALQTTETKADGSPLFDVFVAAEAVSSLVETYAEANAAAAAAPIAKTTVTEIETECGGAPASPECLAERSFALHADVIAARGLRQAWVVHDVNDGLVPYNQGVETYAAFNAAGIPTSFTTVVRSAPDACGPEVGTTATGYAQQQDVACLAGHSSEASSTQAVMRVSIQLVRNLIEEPGTQGGSGVAVWDDGAFVL